MGKQRYDSGWRDLARAAALSIALVAFVGGGAWLAANWRRFQEHREEIRLLKLDAMHLAQGFGTDGHIDREMKGRILRALRAIRTAHPEVRGLHGRGLYTLDSLLVFPSDEAQRTIQPHTRKREDGHLLLRDGETSLAEFDALNARHGASVGLCGLGMLGVWFPRPMDIEVLCREYGALPGIEEACPNFLCGDGDEVFLKIRGGRWHFVFKAGWGDCPSGCINEYFFYYTYTPEDGRVVKHDELPSEKARAGGIYRWGIPNRRATKPFASYDDLVAKVSDETWWVALHAVDVLGFLLTEPDSHRFGEDSEQHFRKLRGEVLAHREAALALLRGCLRHPDEDVREVAGQYLQEIARGKGREESEWRERL